MVQRLAHRSKSDRPGNATCLSCRGLSPFLSQAVWGIVSQGFLVVSFLAVPFLHLQLALLRLKVRFIKTCTDTALTGMHTHQQWSGGPQLAPPGFEGCGLSQLLCLKCILSPAPHLFILQKLSAVLWLEAMHDDAGLAALCCFVLMLHDSQCFAKCLQDCSYGQLCIVSSHGSRVVHSATGVWSP